MRRELIEIVTVEELRADLETIGHDVAWLEEYEDSAKVKVYDVLDENDCLIRNEYFIQNLNQN